MLHELSRVEAYPLDYETDLKHLRTLAVDFPELDLLDQIKRWASYKLDHPLKASSNPRSQLRNWMAKAREFAQHRGGRNVKQAGGHASGGISRGPGSGKYAAAFGR